MILDNKGHSNIFILCYRFGLEYFVKLNAARNKNEEDHSDDESMLSDEEIRRNGINMQGKVNKNKIAPGWARTTNLSVNSRTR